MSANKNISFAVTTETIVKAPNKAEALKVAKKATPVAVVATRIPATLANERLASVK